ncbi:MAG: hypothetical protein NVS9B14_08220 [Candidatus Acidiferrum sp.]
MKRLICFVGICLFLGFAISGLTGSDRVLAQKTNEQVEAEREALLAELHSEELYNLEREGAHAIQLGNSSFVGSVYSDDYTGVTWYGEVLTKDNVIRQIQTSPIRFTQVTMSDIHIKAYQNVAVVTGLRSERGTANGLPVVRQFRVIHVYANALRSWHMIAAQETQLPGQGTK